MKPESERLLLNWSLVVVCMLVLASSPVYSGEIKVCAPPDQGGQGCTDINLALESITNDTKITLLPGTHSISNQFTVHNVTRVVIVGQKFNASSEPPVINCSNYLGLAFIRVSDITIENVILDGCGILGQNDTLVTALRYTFKEGVFDFLSVYQTRVAFFINDSQNVSLISVSIQNTRGIGLLGINVWGLEIVESTFSNNTCDPSTCPAAAGGVYLLYLDYDETHYNNPPSTGQVTISSCTFVNNSKLNSISLFSSSAPGYDRGGGGLTVILSQLHFSVHVEVLSSLFERNIATFGGGAHVALFRGITNNSVKFSDCEFNHNGVLEDPYAAGGMAVLANLPYPTEFQELVCNQGNNTIAIVSTNFKANVAQDSGGVYIKSLHQTNSGVLNVLLDKCHFEGNTARKVSALAVSSRSIDLDLNTQKLSVELNDTTFTRNNVVYNPAAVATVSFQAASVTLNRRNVFSENYGVALSTLLSSVHIDGEVSITNNTGLDCGGGMLLTDSFLVLRNNSFVTLRNNSALRSGGGICVEYAQVENGLNLSKDECVIHLATSDTSKDSSFNATILLAGNVGEYDKTSIFGADPFSCVDNTTVLLDRPELISTPVKTIQIQDFPQNIAPGKLFTITLVAYDSFNQSILDTVYAVNPVNGSRNARVELGESETWLVRNNSSKVPMIVYGKQNTEVTVEIRSLSATSIIYNTFRVNLTTCYLGYKYMYNASKGSCYCDPRLVNVSVDRYCDVNGFVVPDLLWFGPLPDTDDNATLDERNDRIVVAHCPLDYCRHSTKHTPSSDNFDSNELCTNGYERTGLLCGVCKQDYSVTLGTSQCRKCSNYYLFLVIPFALFGILVIVSSTVLRITVSEGFLNSVLFYSNIVSSLSAYFFPGRGDWVLILASVLSLKPRLPGVCLFDGMDSLQYFIFQYVFILYLYILLAVVILQACFTDILAYSPMKAFATLLLMSYGTVTELIITTLAFVRVRTLNGDIHWRWFVDPTVHYFHGTHTFLCVIAIILLLIYVMPTTFLTLFPNRLYNMKFVGRLKPLYDAIWAPYKPRFRWWFGFRLILRWVVISTVTFLHSAIPSNIFALVIILVVLMYLHTAFSPFQGTWQNRVDSILLTNLSLLLIGALYFNYDSIPALPGQAIYSGVLVAMAYSLFVGMLIKHLHSRFYVALKERCINLKLKWRHGHEYQMELIRGDSDESSSDDELLESDPPAAEGELNAIEQENADSGNEEIELQPNVVTFSEFREPLLDEGEADMTTFTVLKRKAKSPKKK